jgi:hypothetical protein
VLRLDRRGLGAEHVASQEQHSARRNRQHSFDHQSLHVGLKYTWAGSEVKRPDGVGVKSAALQLLSRRMSCAD